MFREVTSLNYWNLNTIHFRKVSHFFVFETCVKFSLFLKLGSSFPRDSDLCLACFRLLTVSKLFQCEFDFVSHQGKMEELPTIEDILESVRLTLASELSKRPNSSS
jgi:hypothetical protein